MNIAIFASGSGTNAENIARIFNAGTRARVAIVLTNRRKAGVIDRMRPLDVETIYVPNSVWDENPQEVVDLMREHSIDLIVLAGFMHFVSPVIINAFRGRILNIHPSMLPSYGGKGMYGHYVHEAVIAAGEKQSGVTVHYVTEEMDKGEILMQQPVEVTPEDTPQTLEAKIHPVEYSLYPRAIVKALNRIDAKQSDPPEQVKAEVKEEIPDADTAWAETLKIDFRKPVRPVPPPIPGAHPEPRSIPRQPVCGDSIASAGSPLTKPAEKADKTEPMPSNYLVWSLLAMLLCCLPTGIVALIMSCRVAPRYMAGDLEGARKASRLAEIWIIATIVIGVPLNMIMTPIFSLL